MGRYHNEVYERMEQQKITKEDIEKKVQSNEHKELFRILRPIIQNKSVLDCGAAQHSINQILKSKKPWIHAFLCKYASTVIGIDIAERTIQELRNKGYQILKMNAEKMQFKQEFDVVFGGDIIEHLSNPGIFIKNCYGALKPTGRLVLTTPNTFCLLRVLRIVFGCTNDPLVNIEHTTWFSPTTIKEILKRENFKNIKIYYYYMNKGIIFWLCKILGKKFLNNMLIIAKK